jgi:hypothetical protein
MDWATQKGVKFTGNIMDFKNLTPESLEKMKSLIAEFEKDKYEILNYRGKAKEYFLTEDLQRDTEFEKLKDRFYNKKETDLSDADKDLIIKLFQDRALSFAFVSLEESKILAERELARYKANPALLDELAAIITGQSDLFLKNTGLRILEFGNFNDMYYDIIQSYYDAGTNRIYIHEPANITAFAKMQKYFHQYKQMNNDLNRLFEFTRMKTEIVSLFKAGVFEKELADTLFYALSPYVWVNEEQRKRENVPATIDSPLFTQFRQAFPEGTKPKDDVAKLKCLEIIYSQFPSINTLNQSDESGMKQMALGAAKNEHIIIKDASIDFRAISVNGLKEVKDRVMDVLKEKPDKSLKTQSNLMGDADLVWEFQPLLYHILSQENIEKDHPIYAVIKAKITAVEDHSFWESLGLAALGLLLGVAGIFTGGTTTVLGLALLAGSATVSLIDFAREYDQYSIQSEAYNATFNVPFVNEPSMVGVLLSLGGLGLDVGDVLKVFGKAGKVAAKAGGVASDAVKQIDPAMEALSKAANIDEYANGLFDVLNKNGLIRSGLSKDVFVKAIKENWEQTEELTKSWSKYEDIIKSLPTEVQKLMADSGFAKLAIEIRGSIFRIYDYSQDAFNNVIRFLGESVEKLKVLGLQIFKKNVLASAYGQLSQVLGPAYYEKVVKYFTGFGANAADNLPEILHLMNTGDLFKIPELSLEVLTNRQLQQMLFGFKTNPGHMATLWSEFTSKTSAGGDFIKYIETNTPYGGHLKLTEAAQPLPKLKGAPTNKGVLTDINGRPPTPKSLEGLDEGLAKLDQAMDNPQNVRGVSDPKYAKDYDVEVVIDEHTFRRNKVTNRWCRFTEEVCNIDTIAGLNKKADHAFYAPSFATAEHVDAVKSILRDFDLHAGNIDYDELRKFLHDAKNIEQLEEKIDILRSGANKFLDDKARGIAPFEIDKLSKTEKLRAKPGRVSGGDNLPVVTDENVAGWYNGKPFDVSKPPLSEGSIMMLPKQVVDKLKTKFKDQKVNFRTLREAFWREMHDDPVVNKFFSDRGAAISLNEMKNGRPPFALKEGRMGGGANAKLQLNHQLALEHMGDNVEEVLNFDNLEIVSPKFHDEMKQ